LRIWEIRIDVGWREGWEKDKRITRGEESKYRLPAMRDLNDQLVPTAWESNAPSETEAREKVV